MGAIQSQKQADELAPQKMNISLLSSNESSRASSRDQHPVAGLKRASLPHKRRNPNIGIASRLIFRWSCSMILLRYLTWRISTFASCSAHDRRRVGAALVDLDRPRNTMTINGYAALRSRLAVSRKSAVAPALWSSIQIFPCAFDLHIGLTQWPAVNHAHI
jgi:hypothetical protein